MGSKPITKSGDSSPSLFDIEEEINVAADLVGAIFMASNSLGDRDQVNAMARVAAIATDHLVNATRMIEVILESRE